MKEKKGLSLRAFQNKGLSLPDLSRREFQRSTSTFLRVKIKLISEKSHLQNI